MRRTWSLKKRASNSLEGVLPTWLRYACRTPSTLARHAAKYSFGYFFIPSTGSCLPLALGRHGSRLEQREVVAVRVGEVGRDAVVRLDGSGVLELQSARFEDLEVLAEIVRPEIEVIASAPRFGRRARIQLVFACEQDQLDVRPLGCDGEPSRVARVLVVRPLLEPEHLGVEFQGFLLVAHDDRNVRQFLNHGFRLQHSITHWLFNAWLILVSLGSRSQARAPLGIASVVTTADELIDGQYADRAQLRPIFDALIDAAAGLGQVTIQARKTYVSLVSPRRTFARIQATTKNRVDLGLRLEGRKPKGRLQPSKIQETMQVQIGLTAPDEVDSEVLGWLQQAYDENG